MLLVKILITLLALLLLLPVVDLPVATTVPLWVWVPLLILDLGCVFLLLRKQRTSVATVRLLAGMLGVAGLAVAASQLWAATPPLEGPNSIAVLEKVDLNGREEWITIRGRDASKPVLLYLGIGGPGAGGFPATAMNLKPLEEHFVVVNWDQPGTGKSYGAAPIETLTVDNFIDDAHTLTGLMKTRFRQDKIYVLGLSWGTILGTKLVQQYPEDYYAYVGTGQMVNTTENDRMGYQLALDLTAQQGNHKLHDRLQSYGQPPYAGSGMTTKYAAYNNVLFEQMGSLRLEMVLLLAPQFSREYGLIDKFNFGRGLVRSFAVVYPQLQELDFTTQAVQMQVPMYFLVGRQDVNAYASLVEGYYHILQAPYKELIWLESGHGAGAQEILDGMVNHVLATSPPKA